MDWAPLQPEGWVQVDNAAKLSPRGAAPICGTKGVRIPTTPRGHDIPAPPFNQLPTYTHTVPSPGPPCYPELPWFYLRRFLSIGERRGSCSDPSSRNPDSLRSGHPHWGAGLTPICVFTPGSPAPPAYVLKSNASSARGRRWPVAARESPCSSSGDHWIRPGTPR